MPPSPTTDPDPLEFRGFWGTGFRLDDTILQPGAECVVLLETAEQSEEVLNCIAGLQTPAQGRVCLLGQNLGEIPRDERLRVLSRVGIVPEDGGLLTGIPAWQNILLPKQHQSNLRAEHLDVEFQAALRSWDVERESIARSLRLLPDYLNRYQRRLAAFLRMILCQPAVCIYENFLGNLHAHHRESLLELTRRYHRQHPHHVSVYLEFDPGLVLDNWSGQTLQAVP